MSSPPFAAGGSELLGSPQHVAPPCVPDGAAAVPFGDFTFGATSHIIPASAAAPSVGAVATQCVSPPATAPLQQPSFVPSSLADGESDGGALQSLLLDLTADAAGVSVAAGQSHDAGFTSHGGHPHAAAGGTVSSSESPMHSITAFAQTHRSPAQRNTVGMSSVTSMASLEGECNLIVAGLTREIDDDALRTMFAPFGTVMSSTVMRHVGTGVSRGFGFVLFAREAEGEAAIRSMHGSKCGPNTLNVHRSHHDGTIVETNAVFVRNLPLDVTPERVTAFFGTVAQATSITIAADTSKDAGDAPNGRRYKVATVTLADVDAARECVKKMHNKPFPVVDPREEPPLVIVKFAESADVRRRKGTNKSITPSGAKSASPQVLQAPHGLAYTPNGAVRSGSNTPSVGMIAPQVQLVQYVSGPGGVTMAAPYAAQQPSFANPAYGQLQATAGIPPTAGYHMQPQQQHGGGGFQSPLSQVMYMGGPPPQQQQAIISYTGQPPPGYQLMPPPLQQQFSISSQPVTFASPPGNGGGSGGWMQHSGPASLSSSQGYIGPSAPGMPHPSLQQQQQMFMLSPDAQRMAPIPQQFQHAYHAPQHSSVPQAGQQTFVQAIPPAAGGFFTFAPPGGQHPAPWLQHQNAPLQ